MNNNEYILNQLLKYNEASLPDEGDCYFLLEPFITSGGFRLLFINKVIPVDQESNLEFYPDLTSSSLYINIEENKIKSLKNNNMYQHADCKFKLPRISPSLRRVTVYDSDYYHTPPYWLIEFNTITNLYFKYLVAVSKEHTRPWIK